MGLAVYIGISITEFWEITAAELNIAAEAYHQRKKDETEEYVYKFENQQKIALYQAYLTSRWVWQKRINIQKILDSVGKRKKQMTDEQMLEQVKILNNLFGGEVENGEK